MYSEQDGPEMVLDDRGWFRDEGQCLAGVVFVLPNFPELRTLRPNVQRSCTRVHEGDPDPGLRAEGPQYRRRTPHGMRFFRTCNTLLSILIGDF